MHGLTHNSAGDSEKSLIDFDAWAELAKTDPEGFEVKRRELIETEIARYSPERQQRLRCLQWKIDQVRDRSPNPMAACVKISDMMWGSLIGPGGLKDLLDQLGHDEIEPIKKANVVNITGS